VLGREVEESFPDIMRISEKRWDKAKAKKLLDALNDNHVRVIQVSTCVHDINES
jgi:hypothetical protein